MVAIDRLQIPSFTSVIDSNLLTAIMLVRFVCTIVVSVAHPFLWDALLSRRAPEHSWRTYLLSHLAILLVRSVAAIGETIAHRRRINAFSIGANVLHLVALRIAIIVLAIQFVRFIFAVKVLVASQRTRNTLRSIGA